MKVSTDDQTALKAIRDAKEIGIIASSSADTDAVPAALSLYHLFKTFGKKVIPIVPGKIPKSARSLPASTEIADDFGPKTLVVTLDTGKNPIEKVTYKTVGDKFKLIIHPQNRSFEVENIHYDYQGLLPDLLITLGVAHLSDLGELYEKNQKEFSSVTIINNDIDPQNEYYGQINLVDPTKSSLSELVFNQLLAWQLVPSPEAAQCLLAGLSSKAVVEIPLEIPIEKYGKLDPKP